ncbi:zinc knuckle CX2CX4HX4C containing protein [Tanacetum coccineum]
MTNSSGLMVTQGKWFLSLLSPMTNITGLTREVSLKFNALRTEKTCLGGLNVEDGFVRDVNVEEVAARINLLNFADGNADASQNMNVNKVFRNPSFEIKGHAVVEVSAKAGGHGKDHGLAASRKEYPSFDTISRGTLDEDGISMSRMAGSFMSKKINEEGLIQSPFVTPTTPLPPHQSNVDVAAIFRVSLTTVGDLEVLIKDIDAGKHEELLSGMTNDKHKWDTLLNMQKSSPIGDDSLSGKASPSNPIRMAFLVVEYYARNNWAKHGLKRIMMNTKCLFFFKFDLRAGLEAVLEGSPWLICNSPITLKKWSMDTRLLKEELTRIPIWVKLDDVPLQVFEEDGSSLIDTFIGKPVMLDSYTSAMFNDSWGRSSFVRCLIEVNSEADLVDVVTIGISSLTGDGFTKETICVEYEWRPPRCDLCKIFGHVHDNCPKEVASPPIVTTSNVVTPTVEKTNDGFQTQNVRYEPKATTSEPKKGATTMGNASKSSSMLTSAGTSSKKGNITTSNSYFALENEEEEDEEHVENVYDESANLFPNSKTG